MGTRRNPEFNLGAVIAIGAAITLIMILLAKCAFSNSTNYALNGNISPSPSIPERSAPTSPTQGNYDLDSDTDAHKESLKLAAEELIKNKLKDPESARFQGLQIGNYSGHAIVCGLVNSKNSFNGYSGSQRFAVGGMVLLEEDAQEGAMDEIWAHAGCKL